MSGKFTVAPAAGTVVVRAGGAVIAESSAALQLSEQGHAPVFYLPRADVGMEFLEPSETRTTCPWKGEASHFDFIGKSRRIHDAAWSYEDPLPEAAAIRGHLAFYGDRVTIEVL